MSGRLCCNEASLTKEKSQSILQKLLSSTRERKYSTKYPQQEGQLALLAANEHETQHDHVLVCTRTGQQLTRWSTVLSAPPQSWHLAEHCNV